MRTKWIDELRHYAAEDTSIVLVGTKVDLRSDRKTLQDLAAHRLAPITFSQGVALAKEIGAVEYVECSARTNSGVQGVFETAIRAIIDPELLTFGKKKATTNEEEEATVGDQEEKQSIVSRFCKCCAF